MDFKYLFAAALVLLFANIRVSAEETPQEKFQKFSEDAKKTIQNITSALGLPELETDPAKVQELIKKQGKQFADQFQEQLRKLQTAANDKDSVIQPLIAQLNQTVSAFQTPELQQKTKHLQETATNTFSQVAEQLGKLAKEVGKEAEPNGSLYKATSTAFEKFIEEASKFQNTLQTAIEKQQAKTEGKQ